MNKNPSKRIDKDCPGGHPSVILMIDRKTHFYLCNNERCSCRREFLAELRKRYTGK